MYRAKRFRKTIFAAIGMFGVSIILVQCAGMSTPLPAQDLPATEVPLRSTEAIQTNQANSNLPAQVEIATGSPTAPTGPTFTFTPDAPILQPGGTGAATNLQSEVECVPPGLAIVKLYWTPASKPGQEQRVDVTIYSFDTNFDSSALLSPDQASLVWNQPRGQAIHEWRVLTLQENGWVPSETARFEGPTCVFELQEEEETPVIK